VTLNTVAESGSAPPSSIRWLRFTSIRKSRTPWASVATVQLGFGGEALSLKFRSPVWFTVVPLTSAATVALVSRPRRAEALATCAETFEVPSVTFPTCSLVSSGL